MATTYTCTLDRADEAKFYAKIEENSQHNRHVVVVKVEGYIVGHIVNGSSRKNAVQGIRIIGQLIVNHWFSDPGVENRGV